MTRAWLRPPDQVWEARQISAADLEAFAALIPAELDAPFTRSDWDGLTAEGILYFGCFDGPRLLSRAGVWKRAPDVWEIIAVRTDEQHRQQGLGAAVVHAAARYILEHGAVASYSAGNGNLASLHTAQHVGFRLCTHLIGGEKWCAGNRQHVTAGARCPLLERSSGNSGQLVAENPRY